MAEIVLGIGTSHTPQATMGPEYWEEHAARDVRNPKLIGHDGEVHAYDALLADASPELKAELGLEVYRAKHERIQSSLDRLAERLEAVAPDAVLVVGDDQGELFDSSGIPAIGIFCGASVWDRPDPSDDLSRFSEGMRQARWANHSPEPYEHLVHADLATHLVEALTLDDFDLMKLDEQTEGRSIGHAFNFVRYRLRLGREVPIVPILLNTYVQPNVPSAARCYRLGQSLRRAVESYGQGRFVVVASGGLSHFVVLDDFDRAVLDALGRHDAAALGEIPRRYFRSGTSEVLNWITVGGALEDREMELLDYVPGFRSPAGTGTGMAFATWS